MTNNVNVGQGATDASLMVQSALGQRLHLAGLILSSSMPYPTGPIETITPDTWHETLQTNLLGPISLIQSFLPLVVPF
jgi:NAD(P)-dependent dehydrogenase (short-subunit alcohol dehydrogenase family)